MADLLKEIFSQHLPRVQLDDEDELMRDIIKNSQDSDNGGEDLFGGQEKERESKKRRLKKQRDESPVAAPAEDPEPIVPKLESVKEEEKADASA